MTGSNQNFRVRGIFSVALPPNIKQLCNLMFQLLATHFNSTWTRISSSCRLELFYCDGHAMLYSSLSMLGFVSRLSPDLDLWLCLWHHTLCDLQVDLDLQLDNPFLTVLCETGSFSYPYKLNKWTVTFIFAGEDACVQIFPGLFFRFSQHGIFILCWF